jgi:hypothetical protein
VKRQAQVFAIILAIPHENYQVTQWSKHVTTIPNNGLEPVEKVLEGGSIGKATRVFVIANHLPIGRMKPNEVKLTDASVMRRVCGVEPGSNIQRSAINVQLDANVGTRSTATHRVKNPFRLIVVEQVFYQKARAIATVASVAVLAAAVRGVNARKPWNGAPCARPAWEFESLFRITRISRLLCIVAARSFVTIRLLEGVLCLLASSLKSKLHVYDCPVCKLVCVFAFHVHISIQEGLHPACAAVNSRIGLPAALSRADHGKSRWSLCPARAKQQRRRQPKRTLTPWQNQKGRAGGDPR